MNKTNIGKGSSKRWLKEEDDILYSIYKDWEKVPTTGKPMAGWTIMGARALPGRTRLACGNRRARMEEMVREEEEAKRAPKPTPQTSVAGQVQRLQYNVDWLIAMILDMHEHLTIHDNMPATQYKRLCALRSDPACGRQLPPLFGRR